MSGFRVFIWLGWNVYHVICDWSFRGSDYAPIYQYRSAGF